MPRFSRFEPIDTTGIESNREITKKLPELLDTVTNIVMTCNVPDEVMNPCRATSKTEKREGSSSMKGVISICKEIGSSYDRFDPSDKTVNASLRRLIGALKDNDEFGEKYANKIWFSQLDVQVKVLMDGLIAVLERANKLYYS